MRCQYCYIPMHYSGKESIPDLSLCVEKASNAFSTERLGGICMFNICATGETLLHPQLFDVVNSILSNGHYVMVVTNGTLTERFREYCTLDEERRKRLFFKISLHYLELKRLNLIDRFCENVELIKNSGISYTIELTPDDSYVPYIDEIKSFCVEKFGAFCHITVPRDERLPGFPLMTSMAKDRFKETWQGFDSALFDFKYSIFEVPRNEFCYAGKWGIALNLQTGEYRQCYKGLPLGNLFSNTDKPLQFLPIGHNCQEGHCFNGHAFLGFGLIPEIGTPTFAEMRNRYTNSGEYWLSEQMCQFMSEKLIDANQEYTNVQKTALNSVSKFGFFAKKIINKVRFRTVNKTS